MKFKLSLILLILFCLTQSALAKDTILPIRTYYGNKQVRQEIIPTKDGKDIIIREYHSDGRLKSEEQILLGKIKSDVNDVTCSGNEKNGIVRCEDDVYKFIKYYPYQKAISTGKSEQRRDFQF